MKLYLRRQLIDFHRTFVGIGLLNPLDLYRDPLIVRLNLTYVLYRPVVGAGQQYERTHKPHSLVGKLEIADQY